MGNGELGMGNYGLPLSPGAGGFFALIPYWTHETPFRFTLLIRFLEIVRGEGDGLSVILPADRSPERGAGADEVGD